MIQRIIQIPKTGRPRSIGLSKLDGRASVAEWIESVSAHGAVSSKVANSGMVGSPDLLVRVAHHPTQWDKDSYKQAQIVVVGSLREKHQSLSI
jgi:hypothetical protein